MKKIFKSRLFLVIIAVILTGTVGVFADDILEATGIKYKNKSVEDSLNELYIKANAKDVGALKFCKFIDGTYGSFGEIGSKYECDPGDGVTRNFYLLSINNDNAVNLIMDRNINEEVMTWNNAMEYFRTGEGTSVKTSWANVLDIDLPKAQAIVDAVGRNDWEASNYWSTWWCFGSKSQDIQSNPYCTNENQGRYAWLFNYLAGCTQTGCTTDGEAIASAYWIRDLASNTNHAWHVWSSGGIGSTPVSISHGVRPVITVLKTNLYSE